MFRIEKIKNLSLSEIKIDNLFYFKRRPPLFAFFIFSFSFFFILSILFFNSKIFVLYLFFYILIIIPLQSFIFFGYGDSNVDYSEKISDFVIKNKSQQDLKKEIDDLINHNDFVKYFLELFYKDYETFKKELLPILNWSERIHLVYNSKHFFHYFNDNEENNEKLMDLKHITLLIYLNNVFFELNDWELLKSYCKDYPNLINKYRIHQLKIAKEKILLPLKDLKFN